MAVQGRPLGAQGGAEPRGTATEEAELRQACLQVWGCPWAPQLDSLSVSVGITGTTEQTSIASVLGAGSLPGYWLKRLSGCFCEGVLDEIIT